MPGKRIHLVSLGCPKNQVDSERFLATALGLGFRNTPEPGSADAILINTCGFIADARKESIDAILEAVADRTPGQRIYVTGCLVQRYADELAREIPEVDGWIPLKDFDRLRDILGGDAAHAPVGATPRALLNPGHFAYLRISDGCNNRCAYCVIPDIRGPLRSDPFEKLLDEARFLAGIGVRELIVTAQDITRWGEDLEGRPVLPRLLNALHEIPGFEWIRLLYLHPAGIDDSLLDALDDLPKVLHYFDIPLQHIDDRILNAMRRRINAHDTRMLLDRIRTKFPGCVLRTSLITGFPGEDRRAFNELLRFVGETRFERLGVFAYSPEEGSSAYEMPNRPAERTALRRRDEIMALQAEISANWLNSLVGTRLPVIVDETGREFPLEGRAWFDSPEIDGNAFIRSDASTVGDIAEMEVIESWEYDIVVAPVEKK
jgi:ribosomal protein S12 methylthiotransferase